MKGGAEGDSPATARLKESVLSQTSYVFITNPGEKPADKLMCRVRYNGLPDEYEMPVSELETIIHSLGFESTQSGEESVFQNQLRLNMMLKSIDASEVLQEKISQHTPMGSSWIASKEEMITDLFTESE